MDKKVLLIVQNLPLPQDRRVYSEAKALRYFGWKVLAVSPGNEDQEKEEDICGIKIFRYPKPPKATGIFLYLYEYAYTFFRTFYLALKIYGREKYTVIHIANPPDFFFLIGLFFKLLGVKYVFDQHDLMPEMAKAKFGSRWWLYKILLLIEKLAVKSSDIHIVTCKSGLEMVRKRHRFKAKSVIVKNAIDYSLVYLGTLSKEEMPQISRFKYLCSYIGVMGSQDGVDTLMLSINYVVNKRGRRDIGFILMGDGDDRDRLEDMAKKLGVDSNVIFTGWADSEIISTYLNMSDMGLMPEPKTEYTDNSLHNKVLEYMAHGLPFVSYDLKEAKIAAMEAAIFVENDDEINFGQAIIDLIDDAALRREMGEWGRKQVLKNYNWQGSTKKLAGIYEFLTN